MTIEQELSNMSMPQFMVNRACLEDTLTIQTKCSAQLRDLKALVLEQRVSSLEPQARMAVIIELLTQQKAQLKIFKDRLYFWDRQEQLVSVTHEMVVIVTRMESKVNDMVIEAIDDLSLLSQLSKTFLEILDATEHLVSKEPSVVTEDDFEKLQTVAGPRTLQ